MKYRVSYQCRADGNTYDSHVELESEVAPTKTDSHAIELALKDSRKFHNSGFAGIELVAIQPLP